jgi:hypothetical protein
MFLKSSLLCSRGVRTIWEQATEVAMLKEVKAVFSRSSATMVEDAVGTVAIFALLLMGLHLLPAAV